MTRSQASETPQAPAVWIYRDARSNDAVEFGTVSGQNVALPAHFHDEDQITFVLSGRRRFLLGSELRTIEAGHGVLLPAGSVHRSLPEPAGLVCLNLYVAAADYALAAMMEDAERLWRRAGWLDHGDLLTVVAAHRSSLKVVSPGNIILRRSVASRAAQVGRSREGFSRAFRRRHEMPPHAFDLVTRLNQARQLLRQEWTIAAVAFETGFADQSHFGRSFRRFFGVTPGRYRAGRHRSQTYQTRQ